MKRAPHPGEQTESLRIVRLPHGGYVVQEGVPDYRAEQSLMACTDIDDALGFIKDRLVGPEQPSQMQCPDCKAEPGTRHDANCNTGFIQGAQWTPEQAARFAAANDTGATK